MHTTIDADGLVYAAGFTAQRTRYLVENPDGFCVADFDYKKDAASYVGGDPDLTINPYQEVGEPADAIEIVDSMVAHILEASLASSFTLYLTGGKCWRSEYATILKYKGNRDNMERPIYYDLLRSHLLNKWQAFLVDYIEADDACIMDAYGKGHKVTIASADKDLRQQAGLHLSTRKIAEGVFLVDEHEALLNFYTQLLTGDSADNIKGLSEKGTGKRGIGPAKAAKLLTGCVTERDMFEVCHTAYIDKYGSSFKYEDWRGGIFHERSAMEILDENAQLLYLARYDGDKWEVTK